MVKSLFRLLLFISFLSSPILLAQDEAAMKAFTEYMTPGKMQQQMAIAVGKWDVTIKMYDPNAPEPMVSTGNAEFEMILGGRYLQGKFTGVVMGMAMEGFGLDAYDNAMNEYISVWIDNMGTGMMISKGKMNQETNTLELYGSMVDPVTKTEKKTLSTNNIPDLNKMIQKIYILEDGKKQLSMEMEYIRAK